MKQQLTDFLFILSQYLAPHHLLSRLVGVFAESEVIAIKKILIGFFINRFKIDLSEAQREHPDEYINFNDFFTRALKPAARHIQGDESDWVSPVDGCISQFGTIKEDKLVQAKGRNYSLVDLLGADHMMARKYQNGQFITIYLSPKDYHRIHMPLDAKLVKTTFIPGKLFSVNPLTASSVSNLFARNERLVCEFESAQGCFTMILVGAMIVASIETTWAGIMAPFRRKITQTTYGNTEVLNFIKGEEMGRFRLGSTVIMTFEKDQIRWKSDIKINANIKLGQRL